MTFRQVLNELHGPSPPPPQPKHSELSSEPLVDENVLCQDKNNIVAYGATCELECSGTLSPKSTKLALTSTQSQDTVLCLVELEGKALTTIAIE